MNTINKKDKINKIETEHKIQSFLPVDNLEKDRAFKQVFELVIMAEFLNRQLTEAQSLKRLSISNGQLNKRVDALSNLSQEQVLKLLDAHLAYYEYLISDLGKVLVEFTNCDNLNSINSLINNQTHILENIKNNGYMKQIGLSLDKLYAYLAMEDDFIMDNALEFRLIDAFTKGKIDRLTVAKRLGLDETQVLQMVDVINQQTIGDIYSLIKEQEKLINLIYGPLFVCCNEILSSHQNSWGFQADHIKFINDNDLFTKCTHFLSHILVTFQNTYPDNFKVNLQVISEESANVDEEEFDDIEYYQDDFLEANDEI